MLGFSCSGSDSRKTPEGKSEIVDQTVKIQRKSKKGIKALVQACPEIDIYSTSMLDSLTSENMNSFWYSTKN